MREIYQEVTGEWELADYSDWRELFDDLSVIFDTDEEKEHYWDMFLRAFYLSGSDAGSIPRDRFYRETQIPKSEIGWERWREIKRT